MGTRALAPDLLLGIPEAIETNTEGCNENVPSYCFFTSFLPFLLLFIVYLGNLAERALLTGTTGYYFYNQGQPLESPLGPRRAVDFFNWLAETFNFKTGQNRVRCLLFIKLDCLCKLGSIKCQSEGFVMTLIGARVCAQSWDCIFYHCKSIHTQNKTVKMHCILSTGIKKIKAFFEKRS